ncbi:MAG TPA: YdjY domain-containing protein [Verrucomicrobiae bacterium]
MAAHAPLKETLNIIQTGSNTFRLGGVDLDKAQRTVSIPARVRLRKEVIEYALVTDQGKAYEALLTTACRPADIHIACLLLGLGAAPVTGDLNQPAPVAETNAVLIGVAWETNGPPVNVPLSELVCLTSGKPDPGAPAMKVDRWLYNGSLIDQAGFAAQREGSIISLIRDPVALVNNPGPDRDNDDIHFPNARLLPPEGTAVRIILRFPRR